MNKKILYLVAALLFAHPMAQGFSLNQLTHESIKNYITPENCVKATFVASFAALVVYALWNINGKNHKTAQVSLPVENKNRKLKNGILVYVDPLYKCYIKEDHELLEELIDDLQDYCDQHSIDEETLALKNEFLSALKQNNDQAAIRVDSTYEALVEFLLK